MITSGLARRNRKSSGSTPITSRARAVDHQALADGRGIAAERALPIAMRDQDDVRALRQVVFLREAAAERRPDAEDRQRPVGDVRAFQPAPAHRGR